MINKSKLAFILEDEGLIKTAALKKGEVYWFEAGGLYTQWSLRKGPMPTSQAVVRWLGGSMWSSLGETKESRTDLAVEYLGPFKWDSKLKAMMLDDFNSDRYGNITEGEVTPRVEDVHRWARKVEEDSKGLALFKVVGDKYNDPYEQKYKGLPEFELKGRPWFILARPKEMRPMKDDSPTLRMDDPGFPGNVPPFGSAGLDVIVPSGSYVEKINTQAGWTSDSTTTKRDLQVKLLSPKWEGFGSSSGYRVKGDLGKGSGTYLVDPA